MGGFNVEKFISFNSKGKSAGEDERSAAREMRVLALSKAFSLAHGLDAVEDPEGFEKASQGLAGELERQAELLSQALSESRRAQEREAALHQARLSQAMVGKPARDLAMMDYQLDRSRIAKHSQMGEIFSDAIHQARAALAPWALDVARSSGALAALSEGGEGLARLCGEQKSAQELSIAAEGLENRLDGYELKARRSEQGGIEGFDAVDWGKRSQLVSDAPKEPASPKDSLSDLAMKISFTGIPGSAGASPGAWRCVCAALSPKGAPTEPWSKGEEAKLAQMVSMVTATGKIEQEIKTMRRQAQAIREGAAVSVAAKIAAQASEGSDLALAFGDPLKALAKNAEEIARQDKARRVCEWFDAIAGERSNDLAQKVWGGAIASGLKLSEVEMLARSSKELWAALEGQEALGLFSIRMASDLGLELSGRDLPERAKRAMKERFGLSDGGWRLLGKMDGGVQEEAAQWTSQGPKRTQAGAMMLMDDFVTPDQGGRGIWGQSPQEIQHQKMAMLSLALSACAARGLPPEQAQNALGELRQRMESSLELFGEAKAPPGAGLEDAAAEAAAKKARLSRIMGDWASMAAKDPQKAGLALIDAADWAKAAEWGAWQALPEKAGWLDLAREHKRWTEMLQTRERSQKAQVSWDGLSEGWSDPQTGFSAVPLTDGGMLWDEGKAMDHCVSSYAGKCERGDSRVFSIRKDGERFGTAEVKVGDGSFEVVQFRGRFNKAIEDERAWAAARMAARSCKEAVEARPERLIRAESAQGGLSVVVFDQKGVGQRLRVARQGDGGGRGMLPLPGGHV